MATKVNHLDFLKKKGLRVVQKFNLCGYFEHHVLNYANQTIVKHTSQQKAIDMAWDIFQA